MNGIIGVGNPFKGDDGIGLRLLEEIERKGLPEDVQTFDVGTNSLRVLHVLSDLDKAIILDAVHFGGSPGEYTFFRPAEVKSLKESRGSHNIDLLEILELSKRLNEEPEEIVLMGIEPGSTSLSNDFSPSLKSRIPELTDVLYQKTKSLFGL